MNKKSLATAIIAGITGITGVVSVSNAVHINPDNSGQVLLYPYYNTRNDNNTLISVVNTTDAGKAIKVRFLEGVNSQEVFDFNLYLSPFDVWTAAIVDSAETDGATFITNDTSCTVPYFYGRNFAEGNTQPDTLVNFTDIQYQGDGGPQGLDRTREGYVEMIEMAEVENLEEGTLTSITHVSSTGAPPGCFTVESAFAAGSANPYFIDDIAGGSLQTDMTAPAGGLFGDGTIINVPGARAVGYNATALDGFYDSSSDPALPLSIHTEPGSTLPSLGASGFPNVSNVLLAAGNTPVIVTDTWDNALAGENFSDAVNAVLIVDQVLNQYAIESATAGGTQWVVTHPNKSLTAGDANGIDPYTVPFISGGPAANAGDLCEEALFTVFNREEAQITTEIPPLPSPFDVTLATVELCNEVNILDFAGGGNFASELTVELFPTADQAGVDVPNSLEDVGFESGWAQLAFNSENAVNDNGFDVNHTLTNSVSGNVYQGLPVVGFATRSANAGTFQFGSAFDHAYARIITN